MVALQMSSQCVPLNLPSSRITFMTLSGQLTIMRTGLHVYIGTATYNVHALWVSRMHPWQV